MASPSRASCSSCATTGLTGPVEGQVGAGEGGRFERDRARRRLGSLAALITEFTMRMRGNGDGDKVLVWAM